MDMERQWSSTIMGVTAVTLGVPLLRRWFDPEPAWFETVSVFVMGAAVGVLLLQVARIHAFRRGKSSRGG
jgi:hypothetical protein